MLSPVSLMLRQARNLLVTKPLRAHQKRAKVYLADVTTTVRSVLFEQKSHHFHTLTRINEIIDAFHQQN